MTRTPRDGQATAADGLLAASPHPAQRETGTTGLGELEAAARRQFRLARRRRRLAQVLLGLLAIALVIAGYAVVSGLPTSNPALLPPLSKIVSAMVDGIRNGSLLTATWASLRRVAVGYVLGCLAAILIGSLRGWYRTVGYLLDPIIDALRPVPALAYIPLVILWFGIGESARVLVIGLAAFLSCVVSVTAGMHEVPPAYVDAARTLGASRGQVFRTIALPASVPYIFAGLRVALGAAWGTLVAAELIAAQNGLGFLLEQGQQFFQTVTVIVALILIGVLGYLMDLLLKTLQRRLLRWSPGGG
jgi:ABC-type nitrate/sulfonate/bicarbonate transport system permease component